MDYKAEFIRIFSENVSRPGAQQLLDWLATTDFYTAPASTRFHGAVSYTHLDVYKRQVPSPSFLPFTLY